MRAGGMKGVAYFLSGTIMLIAVSSGQAVAGSVKWSQLSGNERAVLAAFAGNWDAFPTSKQQTLRRWAAKSARERERIRSRYAAWKRLSPARQHKIEQQLQRYKRMPPDKRARLKAWRAWVKTLPVAEQRKLSQAWPRLSEAERKAYMQNLRRRYGR